MKHFYNYFGTTHDSNGNPRRVYVVYNELGQVIDVFDERYNGDSRIKVAYHDVVMLGGRVQITPAEYRTWLSIKKTMESK